MIHHEETCMHGLITLIPTLTATQVLSSGAILNSEVTMNSHTLSMETHWIVPITAMSWDVCFRLLTESFCSPTPKFLKCPYNLSLTFFFCLKTKFQMKKIDVYDKVIKSYFFQMCPGICRNICLICPCHVTDCYCTGNRNLNKFFQTSQEHCTNQVTITLMTTLLPDQVTFIFPLRKIVIVKLGNHCALVIIAQYFKLLLLR